jgi:tRNA threonylcarbamoyl adenosine modification protein YjeE
MKTVTGSAMETRALGARVAAGATAGDCFALEGGLGAGKTEFVRGFVASLAPSSAVKSPSFSILNIYETAAFPVYHFDFYRLADASELLEIGFEEYVSGVGVCLIEWGTMFPEVLPKGARTIRFRDIGGDKREIEIG